MKKNIRYNFAYQSPINAVYDSNTQQSTYKDHLGNDVVAQDLTRPRIKILSGYIGIYDPWTNEEVAKIDLKYKKYFMGN